MLNYLTLHRNGMLPGGTYGNHGRSTLKLGHDRKKNLVEQTAIILNSDGILIKSILNFEQNLWKMVVGSKVSLGRFNIKMDQIGI